MTKVYASDYLYQNEEFDSDNSKIYDLWNSIFLIIHCLKNSRICYMFSPHSSGSNVPIPPIKMGNWR